MTALLVVAKAPVAGLAKTRLCPPATPEQAAEIAAASLLDTLDAVRATHGTRAVVALTGDLDLAARAPELREGLATGRVLPQRGDGFPQRLAHAHADTAAAWPGMPVLQIGMDTPQVTAALLGESCERLATADAVYGPAADGGWWAVGFRDPRCAALLADVPTSRPDTGRRTLNALRAAGLRVCELPELTDVDTMPDARAVAELVPRGRFAAAVAGCPR
ncbi:TIGR04282 family arsenosugar biosynthesis glycosyltransferase [Saccharopolyspora tripterygii]